MRRRSRAPGPDLRVLVGERLRRAATTTAPAATRDLRVVSPLVLLVVLLTLVVLLRAIVAPLYLLGTVILSFLGAFGVTLRRSSATCFDQDGLRPDAAG